MEKIRHFYPINKSVGFYIIGTRHGAAIPSVGEMPRALFA